MKYSIYARYVPAVLTSIPLLAFYFFFLRRDLGEFLSFLNWFQFIKDMSLISIFIFIVSFFSRYISKYVFEDIIFEKKKKFPTTEFLMPWNDFLSKNTKDKICHMIESDIGIKIVSNDNTENTDREMRKRIVESIKYISNSLRDWIHVLNRNIEYGFMRNFIWGSVMAFIISIIWICFSNYPGLAFNIFTFFIVAYGSAIIFSKKILRSLAETYAETLLLEYISKK